MTRGMVLDIREFALHDGPGIRTTVFMKGCPLRCSWCHNPDSQSPGPQRIESAGIGRVVGTSYESSDLVAILQKQAHILQAYGGVTFSGGEPLAQAGFLCEVIDCLPGIHCLLDTSGYAPADEFRRVATMCDLVYYDLKLIDAELHRRYTGADNAIILANLQHLSTWGVPFVIRVPLAPGVTDTEENLCAIARIAAGLPSLIRIDLLPYNRAAGGKYAALGMRFDPGFDASRDPILNTRPFDAIDVEVRIVGRDGFGQ